MTKVLITGSTGFIGKQLVSHLIGCNYQVQVSLRHYNKSLPEGINQHIIGPISCETNWKEALTDIDVIIHLAGITHYTDSNYSDGIDEVNVAGSLNLAAQALEAGAKRFIFMSSIGVNGNQTKASAFTEEDEPNPVGDYPISKLKAEAGLVNILQNSDLDLVILRAPLVYGTGIEGSLLTLINVLNKGIPLPLGAIHNKRSLVALGNLVDLIAVCIDHPKAKNQIFLISDGNDFSTTELLHAIAKALHKSACLLPVPQSLLSMGLKFLGKAEINNRLCGSLQVDISKVKTLLGWSPPVSTIDGIQEMVNAYLELKQG